MRIRTALCLLPLLAVNSCGEGDTVSAIESPPAISAPSAIPAPSGTPSADPVDGAIVRTELARAVRAMQGHRDAEGTHTRSPNALANHGFVSSKVLLFVPYADEDRYCIEATSSTDTTLVFAASNSAPAPRQGGCRED